MAKSSEIDAVYASDAFRMYYHKIQPCSKRYAHDWTACPFAHQGERARRRDPRSQSYSAVICPEMHKNGTCKRGDDCPMSHNLFEYWLHPDRYRTQLCKDGATCSRRVCFFAHSLQELRTPRSAPGSTSHSPAAGSPGVSLSLLPGMPRQQQEFAATGSLPGLVGTASSGSSSQSPVIVPSTATLLHPQQQEQLHNVLWGDLGGGSQQLQPIAAATGTAGSYCSSSPSCHSPMQLLGVADAVSRSGSFSSNLSNIAWPQVQQGQCLSDAPVLAQTCSLLPSDADAGLLACLARQIEQHGQQEAAARLQLVACRSQIQALTELAAGAGDAVPGASSGVARLLQPSERQVWGSLCAAPVPAWLVQSTAACIQSGSQPCWL